MRTVNMKNREVVEIKKDGKTIYRILAENGLIAISEMPNEMEVITGNRASQYISAKEGIEKNG